MVDNSLWKMFSASATSAGDHDVFVERVLSLVGDPLEKVSRCESFAWFDNTKLLVASSNTYYSVFEMTNGIDWSIDRNRLSNRLVVTD